MTILTADITKWTKRNIVMRGRRMLTRPGLRVVKDLAVDCAACKSVRVPATGETRHIIVTAGGNVTVYSDAWTQLFTIAAGTINVRTASFAADSDQILVASPDFPTIHGYIGSGWEFARKKASVNPGTTAIDIPSGVVVAWAGRWVIADGAWLYISDALEPRTFVGQNLLRIESASPVYGAHVTAEGALVAVTGNGIFALPESAASVGQIALGTWSKLLDGVWLDYDVSAVSGRDLWALTQRGVRRVLPAGPEIDLDEDVRVSYPLAPHHFDDYREARIFGGQRGPIISIGGRTFFLDGETGVGSWWHMQDSSSTVLDVVGLLEDGAGEEMLLCATGEVVRIGGNFDGPEALHAVNGSFAAHVIGSLDLGAADAPTVRKVTVKSQAREATFPAVSVNTSNGQMAAGASAITVGVIREGTTTWASTDTAADPRMSLHRKQVNVRAPDVEICIAEFGGQSEIGSEIEVEVVASKKPEQTT